MKYRTLNFGQAEDLMDRIGGIDGLNKILSGEWTVGEAGPSDRLSAVTDRLLEPVGDKIAVYPQTPFVAGETFVPNLSGELAISLIGDDFRDHFLGLVEHGSEPATLQPYRLSKSSTDDPVFAALGGKSSAAIRLGHLFEFLKTADRAQWFFFYVADVSGAIWAIDTYWRDGGWDIEAYSITYPRGWRGGGHVVSSAA